MSKERKHLSRVLYANVYPKHFIGSATAYMKGNIQNEQEWTPKTTINFPYVAGVSEEIRRICKSYNV